MYWSAAFEIRLNCCFSSFNLEQRLSSLKSSHLMHTLFLFMKLMTLEFLVKIQLLSVVLRAAVLLGLIGLVIGV